MQVVIEKLQAGAQKAQEVARKLETPAPSAEGVEALVSPSSPPCRVYHQLLVTCHCHPAAPKCIAPRQTAIHGGMRDIYSYVRDSHACLVCMHMLGW